MPEPWYVSHRAQVIPVATPVGQVLHLRVWRMDGRDGISWDTLEEVKNELCGPEQVAVEFYPAAPDVVNDVNMRHLWIIPPHLLPFGLHLRGYGWPSF